MSYGLTMNNDAGWRTLDENFLVPQFLGKITLNATPTSVVGAGAGVESPYNYYRHAGAIPTSPGRARMILWTLPSTAADVFYSNVAGSILVAGAGTIATWGLDVVAPSSSYVLPEGYVFAVDSVTAVGGHGLQLFNAAGALIFDSNSRHLDVRSILSGMAYPNTGTASLTAGALPAKPAFLLSNVQRKVNFKDGPSDEETTTVFAGVTRRNGLTFTTKQVQIGQTVVFYSGAPSGTTTYPYGNVSGLNAPVINAAAYD